MTVQISIIGLGQIGSSIGLALASQKELIKRVGHDREPSVSRKAKEIGAVDRTEYNLHAAVAGADLVLLTLPIDQIKETMEQIAPDLREGAVVMDTAPVKEIVAAWASELLTPGCHYVGLIPVLNPAYLEEHAYGIKAAHADLFQRGILVIATPPNTNSEAIKLAADLAQLLGATPLFADTAEMDGLMASTYLLPQLMAAALLNITVDQPGWREARKVAGRAYTEATNPITQSWNSGSLSTSAIFNHVNAIRTIDSLIAALQAMRNDIEQQNEDSLHIRLERAINGHTTWWNQRKSSDWSHEDFAQVEMPRAGDFFGRLVGIRRKPKPKN